MNSHPLVVLEGFSCLSIIPAWNCSLLGLAAPVRNSQGVGEGVLALQHREISEFWKKRRENPSPPQSHPIPELFGKGFHLPKAAAVSLAPGSSPARPPPPWNQLQPGISFLCFAPGKESKANPAIPPSLPTPPGLAAIPGLGVFPLPPSDPRFSPEVSACAPR